jgi:hypothetical protein
LPGYEDVVDEVRMVEQDDPHGPDSEANNVTVFAGNSTKEGDYVAAHRCEKTQWVGRLRSWRQICHRRRAVCITGVRSPWQAQRNAMSSHAVTPIPGADYSTLARTPERVLMSYPVDLER